MVTNWGGGGGKAAKSVEYGRTYPVCTEEPVRREGATGPERPKRMRPDGAVCYVEGKHGRLGVKRKHVQQSEQTSRVRLSETMACIWSIVSDGSEVQLNGNC